MLQFAKAIFVLLLINTQVLLAQKGKQTIETSLQNDLVLFNKCFEGEFDNFQQVFKQKEDKVANVQEHIHSIFKKVSLPQIGNCVYYVLQYSDGDSTKIYRQRLYNFTINKIAEAIQLTIYSFKNDGAYYYSHVRPFQLEKISLENLTTTDGCEVYWKKQGEKFIGFMTDKACNLISKRSGKKVFITDSLVLTKDEIWIRDEAYDEQRNYVFGNKDKIHHKLKRCTFYKGWILLEKAGFTAEYHQQKNSIWHDQGKRIRLFTKDGKPTKYEIELANVIYGKDLEVLKLALYEVGVSKAIMYNWGSPQTKNIGINLRWLQTGLTKL